MDRHLPAVDPADFDQVWREHGGYLRGVASRMLGDPTEAEDVVQDAFGRLASVGLAGIEDPRGWLVVVVRRLCLDRLRSARTRREAPAGDLVEGVRRAGDGGVVDPVDRVTLDDQVQSALGVVLRRLTAAERTAFLLHDVFGFSFEEIGEIVGRTTGACRQLASRARRSIRTGGPDIAVDVPSTRDQVVLERFVAACGGGDLAGLMAVLASDVDGHGTLLGHGPLPGVSTPEGVAEVLLGLFGPGSPRVLVPIPLGDGPGLAAFEGGRVVAVVELAIEDGRIRHMQAFVRPGPAPAPDPAPPTPR